MTIADQDIQALTDQLGLAYYRQDWGIANADARRIREFMQVCRMAKLTPPQQYAMVELVLASMNEALVDGVADLNLIDEFKVFLTLDLHGLSPQLHYWASLADQDEFPVSSLLEHEAAV